MSMNRFHGAVEWVLMVALVFGAGAMAQAQDEDASGGPVIQIGKGDVEDPEAVLNGIAYDQSSSRLFVTGKLWPRLFEIKIKR